MGKLTGWITDLATCEKQKRELEKNIPQLRKDHTEILQNYRTLFIQKAEVDKVTCFLAAGRKKSKNLGENFIVNLMGNYNRVGTQIKHRY